MIDITTISAHSTMLAMRNINNGHPINNKFEENPNHGQCPYTLAVELGISVNRRIIYVHFLIQGSMVSGGSGTVGLGAPTALEEYVDILSVQQLLLDTPNTATSTGTAATTSGVVGGVGLNAGGGGNGVGVQKSRPRLNVQKAVEYSHAASSVLGNHTLGEFD